jgi:tetratricopeptide (TPR) repeat protein
VWAQELTGQTGEEELTPASVKADFDAALVKPLSERVPELEALDASLSAGLTSGELAGKDRTEGLYYQYHTRRQLARYPEACRSYADYLVSIRQRTGIKGARRQLESDLKGLLRRGEHGHVDELSGAVLEELGQDDAVKAAALYHQARARYRLNGRLADCVASCEALIAEHPESPWRGPGMRLLANAQLGRGKYKEALGVLELLKAQGKGTKLEHYADMRPGAIWEVRGEPQKALAVYQGTLERYPDHMYSPYVHRQIERLQKVIEEQLIQDALEGLGKADEPAPAAPAVGAAPPPEVDADDEVLGAAPPEAGDNEAVGKGDDAAAEASEDASGEVALR